MRDVDRLRLIRTPGIGPVTYRQLIARFGDATRALAALPDLARRGGGTAPRPPEPRTIERELRRVAELGARHVFIDDSAYPMLLAELESAPPAIVVRGDIALAHKPVVAIVGARNASAAACRFARQIAHDLANAGTAVVSGLARGIDTAAHMGASRQTIAVIAGGIDVPYPPENEALQQQIGEEALLIAEMPPAPSRARGTSRTATASSPGSRRGRWWSRPRPDRGR